jgi:heat shock protein HslJ
MLKLEIVLSVLAMGLALVGCESQPRGVPKSAGSLPGTWRLVSVESGAGVIEASGLTEIPFVVFEPDAPETATGSITGFGGINRFFGRYTMTSDGLVMSNFGSTRMAGPPELMRVERTFLSALENAKKVRTSGRSLVLESDEGRVTLTPMTE